MKVKGDDHTAMMLGLGQRARAAARELLVASTEAKRTALTTAAAAIRRTVPAILEANALDLKAARDARRPAATTL